MELTAGAVVICICILWFAQRYMRLFCKHHTPPEIYFCYFRNNHYT